MDGKQKRTMLQILEDVKMRRCQTCPIRDIAKKLLEEG
jgi:hypothetical protein